jgi:hypothetical protein
MAGRVARRGLAVVLVALASTAATAGALSLRHARDARQARALDALLVQPPGGAPFDPAMLEGLPDPARRYLARALAPGTVPAGSARVVMRGRFRTGTEWIPASATERLSPDGFLWDAAMNKGGAPVRVWDGLGPDGGVSRVWMFGFIPLVRKTGPDITRSAAGRLAAELIWLPEALLPGGPADARWEPVDADTARVRLTLADTPLTLTLRVGPAGLPQAVWLDRWGDPDDSGHFRAAPFGASVTATATFDGHTIPSRVAAGWGYGTPNFSPFFEAEVTQADYSGSP